MTTFKVHLKDPDGFYESVRDEAKAQVMAIDGIDPDEAQQLIEERHSKIMSDLDEWVEFGEYAVLEFNLDQSRARVVPLNEDEGSYDWDEDEEDWEEV